VKKDVLEQLEFEKSKREILRQTQSGKSESVKKDASHKYAWELELEQYRKNKKKEVYLIVGATLGIISFIMQVVRYLMEF
jgi:hypothetical protein